MEEAEYCQVIGPRHWGFALGSLSTRRFWVTNVNRKYKVVFRTYCACLAVSDLSSPTWNPALAVLAGCHRRHGLGKETCYVSNQCVLTPKEYIFEEQTMQFLTTTCSDSGASCLHLSLGKNTLLCRPLLFAFVVQRSYKHLFFVQLWLLCM